MNFMTLGALRRAPHESLKRSRNWYPLTVVISSACAALLVLAASAATASACDCAGSAHAGHVGTTPHAATPKLLQRIDAARTRSEHQALASYYEREAVAARAIAAEHRKLASSDSTRVSGGRGEVGTVVQCSGTVREQEGIAAEYDGMAEGHHELAKRAQP